MQFSCHKRGQKIVVDETAQTLANFPGRRDGND